MAIELETVNWGVDSVFDEADSSVPHYNYRLPSRETLGSTNLEVFVEEDQDGGGGTTTTDLRSSCNCSSSAGAGGDQTGGVGSSSRAGSSGSASSIGLKLPRE